MTSTAPQPDESLSDAQRAAREAAMERILEIKQALAEKNIYVRVGMELEFFTEHQGSPVAIPAQWEIHEWMRKNGFAYFEEFKPEVPDAQYELIFGDGLRAPADFAPERIADEVAQLKAGKLKQALQTETALYSPKNAGLLLEPNFAARPYADRRSTSSLHVNISLYDKDSNNLFETQPGFIDLAINKLLIMQRDGGITMLPAVKSFERLTPHLNAFNPSILGVPVDSDIIYGTLPFSAARKTDLFKQHPYIENRLPGADADPYVALAATMAAMYEAVINQQPEVVKGTLPQNMQDAADRFTQNRPWLERVLGDRLYSVIDSIARS